MTTTIFSDQLTAEGFERVALTDILVELQALYYAAYGSDADLGATSADGQICGGLAEMFDDLNGIAFDTYRGLVDPNAATGQMLSGMAYLTGISRNGASYSTAPAVFSGTPGTVIGTTAVILSTLDGSSWSPAAQVTIGVGGTVAGTLVCSVAGPPSQGRVPSGSITQIQTPITGWTSVTNSLGTIGYNVEGDANLRVRRQRSTSVSAQGCVDAMQAAILNLDGVQQAVVWENATSANMQLGTETLGPNSVYVVAKVNVGGPADPAETDPDDDPIALAIFRTKGAGCNTNGSVTKYGVDSRGHSHTIKYSLAVEVPIKVEVIVKPRYNWPADGPQRIADAIAAWAVGSGSGKPNAPIGGDSRGALSWTDVLGSFLTKVPGFDLSAMVFSRDGGSTWTANLSDVPLAFNEIIAIASDDVNVNTGT